MTEPGKSKRQGVVGRQPRLQGDSSVEDSPDKEFDGSPNRNTNTNVNYDEIGLHQYSVPKREDYITKDSREKSFTRWSERGPQKKEAMAEAGFFYYGLRDHVRCFHCGIGICNWQIDANPWEEHAHKSPNCNYVIIHKGQEFIDKVHREKPPYLCTAASKDGKPQKVSASSGTYKPISDEDLNYLMHGQIIQVIRGMGFSEHVVRKALHRKLEQTGIPFFSIELCIEAVFQVIENETWQTIQDPRDEVEEEAVASLNDKRTALNIQPSTVPSSSSGSNAAPLSAIASIASTSECSNEASASSIVSVSAPFSITLEPSVSNATPLALSVPSVSTASSTPVTGPSQSSGTFRPKSDEYLNIIQAARDMGFSEYVVWKTLRRQVMQTGIPFFSIEHCIETVFQIQEMETRQTIQFPSEEVEEEAVACLNDKITALNIQPSIVPSSSSGNIAGPSSASAFVASTSECSDEASASSIVSVSTPVSRTLEPSVSSDTPLALSVSSVSTASSTPATVPPQSSGTFRPISDEDLNIIQAARDMGFSKHVVLKALHRKLEQTGIPFVSIEHCIETLIQVTQEEVRQTILDPIEDMDIDDERTEAMETQSSETQSMNVPGTVEAMQGADERISVADKVLKLKRPVASEEAKDDERKSTTTSVEGQVYEGVNKSAASNEIFSCEDIAVELERMKEVRTCKICMDAEITMMFLPCAHMVTCVACAVAMTVCPICRHDIKHTVKPIFS